MLKVKLRVHYCFFCNDGIEQVAGKKSEDRISLRISFWLYIFIYSKVFPLFRHQVQ